MAFPQKLQFVFNHFTTVILTGVANAFYAQMIHMISCSEMFTKLSAFQESILIYSVQVCRQVPPFFFFFFFFLCFFCVFFFFFFCFFFFFFFVLFWGRCIVIALRAEKDLHCNSNMADGQMVPIFLLWRRSKLLYMSLPHGTLFCFQASLTLISVLYFILALYIQSTVSFFMFFTSSIRVFKSL